MPFVFITNRINSYSLNPTIHLKTQNLLPNTISFAVVAYNYMNNEIAEMERGFLNIPSVIVKTLEEAFDWSNTLLEKKRNTSK